jgi:SAM-dependent methyltransferase
VGEVDYDTIGRSYSGTRQTDPRLAAAIWAALGDASSVLNVGAGAGAYEPPDREVLALEPSEVMIAQRPEGAAPVLRARAEEIPLEDGSFDAAMAVLSDHHWRDRPVALRELRRVARRRVVVFNADPSKQGLFWLNREYLPGFVDLIPEPYRNSGRWIGELEAALGTVEVRPVPIPHDCRDGFYGAFWRRPAAYLERRVRDGISVFARLAPDEVEDGIGRLRADLASGEWERRHADLLGLDELDLGYCVVVAELGPARGA